MKLIITSPDALYDWENKVYFPDIIESLRYFKTLSPNYEIVVLSNHKEKLDIVPNDFKTLNISGVPWYRKSKKAIEHISGHLNIEFEDIFVLGAKVDDMILAANAKLILLTADYARKNNPEDRIYTGGYGIAIMSATRLNYFFDHYLNIHTPWFCSHEVNANYTMYGLTNAMTGLMKNKGEVEICGHLKKHLKDGHEAGKNPFRVYSLLSMYRIFKEVHDINYWGYYPSSDGLENEALGTIKDILRKSFGSRITHPLLIRHTASKKRNHMPAISRISDGCDSQFKSIHLNPWYKNRIRGNNFCIIDDFSTHGTSSETVRHLLESQGANKVIFISLGKFKFTYKEYNYTLSGDVFTPNYSFSKNGPFVEKRVSVNEEYSEEFMHSLRDSFYE